MSSASKAEVKVAIPSGKLWIPMVRATIIPVRFNFDSPCISSTPCASCGLMFSGIKKSIALIKAMPAKKAIIRYNVACFSPKSAVSAENDVGIISIKDT